MNDEHTPVEPRHRLGVLLVHGIGQQTRGDTLVRFGDSIQRCISRWMAADAHPSARDAGAPVTDARLAPPSRDLDAPPCAELSLPDGSRWLLAESWWAGSFLAPSYADLAGWGSQILPWTLSTHFATRARRAVRDLGAARGVRRLTPMGRLGLELVGLLATVLLLPLFVMVLVLVLIVGRMPVPTLRGLAARMQRALSATIGDSYVLIASPIQEAAIVGHVERDLRWLCPQCERLAVVAHSQGAAIAHSALRRFRPVPATAATRDRVAAAAPDADAKLLFVTVGSGLNKLAEIRGIRDTARPATTWAAPIGLLLMALALPEVYAGYRDNKENFLALYTVIAGLMVFMVGVVAAWRGNRPRADELALGEGVEWLDFYASADPVPNGALFDSVADTRALMQAHEVHNLASPLFDHVTYWRNEDGFVAQLASRLAALGGLRWSRPDTTDDWRLAVARRRRRWRVRWLATARLAIAAATIAVGVRYWHELPTVTQAALNELAPTVSWLPAVEKLLLELAHVSVASQFVAATAVALGGIAAYHVVYAAWAFWNRSDSALFFDKERDYAPAPTRFVAFIAVLVMVLQALVLSVTGHAGGLLPGLIAAAATWTLTLLAVAMVGVFVVGTLVQLGSALRALWRTLVRRRSLPADAADSAAPTAAAALLAAWPRQDLSRRIGASLVALVLATLPYQAVVAASIAPSALWAEGWWWRYGLVNAIEQSSRSLPIAHWQWLLSALALVGAANVVTGILHFDRLRAWFATASASGPIAVQRAADLSPEQALAVLRSGARFVQQTYLDLETRLTTMLPVLAANERVQTEPRSDGRPAQTLRSRDVQQWLARRLAAITVDARQIAARLPHDDDAAGELLGHTARFDPFAAMLLADRLAAVDPRRARELLQRHRQQSGWFLRWRVRRAIAALPA